LKISTIIQDTPNKYNVFFQWTKSNQR